jgi:hypothetical protein
VGICLQSFSIGGGAGVTSYLWAQALTTPLIRITLKKSKQNLAPHAMHLS